jgi:hypothetical protein
VVAIGETEEETFERESPFFAEETVLKTGAFYHELD